MKQNAKMIRIMKSFEQAVHEDALKPMRTGECSESIDYQRLHAKFTRLMDHESQHGPVKIIMANGKAFNHAS